MRETRDEKRANFGEGEGGVVIAGNENDVVSAHEHAAEGFEEEGMIVENCRHCGHGVFGGAG